jgi:uncharacterized repeat protein (TIGR03803 family)
MAHRASGTRYRSLSAAFAVTALLTAFSAHATTFTVLHNFTGSEGMRPQTTLLRDSAGNLFGTAQQGEPKKSTGMVFELTTKGRLLVLHAFRGHVDGRQPWYAPVIADPAGNLYGTTTTGGKPIGAKGGTVFKIAPDGTESLPHIFPGVPDGLTPVAGLAMDAPGNLYGTTAYGGTNTQCSLQIPKGGCGTVFKLAPDGAETVLYAFKGPPDGFNAAVSLVDGAGNIFGVTSAGGNSANCGGAGEPDGCGTIFEISAGGTYTILHNFQGLSASTNDGSYPLSALIPDDAGNLYGATYSGGTGSTSGTGCVGGCGTIFKLTPDGTETVLYALQGDANGSGPIGALVRDPQGNLYGTASTGGDLRCIRKTSCGLVYKLTPDGTFTVLHAFEVADGIYPAGGLTSDAAGNLYGTTSQGGAYTQGTVFELTP